MVVPKLYISEDQKEEFDLYSKSVKLTAKECDEISAQFREFNCDNPHYKIASPTREFNCIGWSIGVRSFISPEEISEFYHRKNVIKDIKTTEGTKLLYDYEKSTTECMKSTMKFLNKYKGSSKLPNKDSYHAFENIDNPPMDNTIAFYFKPGQEFFHPEEDRFMSKGFLHASRYIKELDTWVSDVWTSKLGAEVLTTHSKYELIGDLYGEILCYLVPIGNSQDQEEL